MTAYSQMGRDSEVRFFLLAASVASGVKKRGNEKILLGSSAESFKDGYLLDKRKPPIADRQY